jgi:hypothetical protein
MKHFFAIPAVHYLFGAWVRARNIYDSTAGGLQKNLRSLTTEVLISGVSHHNWGLVKRNFCMSWCSWLW